MKKLFVQLLLLASFLFAIWYGFSLLPWSQWFKADIFNKKKQKQLSELFIKAHRLEKTEITDDSVRIIINSIKNTICLANDIDTGSIHVYVFTDAEINAFAVPDGNIIVNTSLIRFCDNADMLAGVMAHEIGHIENGHIKKRIAKEIGLNLLMMLGGDNLGIIKEVLRNLSSSKFDRRQESEADLSAVLYLNKANINATPLAQFFNKMAKKYGNAASMLEWISTHPNAKQRAVTITKLVKKKDYSPALAPERWSYLQAHLY